MVKERIAEEAKKIFEDNYGVSNLNISLFMPEETNKDYEGDFTIVVFPLLKYSKTSPEKLATFLGEKIVENLAYIESFNVVKGFLNLTLSKQFWTLFSNNFTLNFSFEEVEKIVIEFSSPNTNKPLHLGHIRNNLLGEALSNLLKDTGNEIIKVSLLNDRGVHIMKAIVAWEEYGNRITPEEAGKKGDHLIGDFYVKFDQEYKKQVKKLIEQGMSEEEAKKNAPILKKAQKMLKKWERGNKEVVEKWKKVNDWVLKGFEETYKKLGVTFDKLYYESDTYLLGKDLILKELSKGKLKMNPDNSISIDLRDVGLDEKILLRSDGTSVYITQDIGTAVKRYEEFNFDKHIYVVGNEQIYHFKVLREILKRFGFEWYDKIIHYSYGMVELPEGKMKSREGKVVDADDLIEEMYKTAEEKANELGKLDGLSIEEKESIIKIIAMGALKYFILKVDPKKNMMFNPQESIDFNGNTGPFIQYTYTRINSLLEKSGLTNISVPDNSIDLHDKELSIIKELFKFKEILLEASKNLNPALIANYVYNLAKMYNSFYQELPILKSKNETVKLFRLKLSYNTAQVIKKSLAILGIDVPSKM